MASFEILEAGFQWLVKAFFFTFSRLGPDLGAWDLIWGLSGRRFGPGTFLCVPILESWKTYFCYAVVLWCDSHS